MLRKYVHTIVCMCVYICVAVRLFVALHIWHLRLAMHFYSPRQHHSSHKSGKCTTFRVFACCYHYGNQFRLNFMAFFAPQRTLNLYIFSFIFRLNILSFLNLRRLTFISLFMYCFIASWQMYMHIHSHIYVYTHIESQDFRVIRR